MRNSFKLAFPALAVSLFLAACGGGYGKSKSSTAGGGGTTSGAGTSTTVKTASNAKLGHMVLVDSQGLTLYHLSGEASGKFICTGSCESAWHPLTVSAGSKPSGTAGSLTVVKRPDGASQVAYKGMPLYTFAQDRAPGETNGQGFKDVGTWSAVVTSGSPSAGAGGSTGSTMPESGGSSGY